MPTSAEEAIYNRLAAAPVFHPSSTDLFANDWTTEPGDVVTVESGEESFSVPVYSMNLEWKGKSKVNIQSTGNQKRTPLSALRQKTYSGGRSFAIEQNTNITISKKAAVYRQWNDPALVPTNNVKAGDVWIKTNGIRLWGDTQVGSWAGLNNYEWRDQYGSKLYVRTADGTWELQNDDATTFEQTTSITKNEKQIAMNASKVTTLGTQTAQLKVTADEISATVTQVQADQNTMRGQISVQADKIGLVVTESQGQNVIRSAQIVAAINNAGSNVVISADHIQLSGDTTLAGKFTLTNGVLWVNSPAYISGNLTVTGQLTLPSTSSGIRWVGTGSGEYYDISTTILKGMIKSVSVANNTLTLTPFYGDPINFSKATSLSGAWSGSPAKYVVTASPQGTTLTYDPPMRLNGNTQASNFSAEITETTGGSTVARKSIYGHMKLTSSGSSSYVDVMPGSSGTGTPVARLSVGSIYTAGHSAGYIDGQDYEIANHSVQMYPNGSSDMGTSQTLPTGATSLGTLAQLINNNVGRRLYVWFDAYVQDADGTYSARKRYALAIN